MVGLMVLAAIGVVVVIVARWLWRYQRSIDRYHEREFTDPPIFDITDLHR